MFRSEIQSLKKEITDQEDSFKIQISAADKKASDYWVYVKLTMLEFLFVCNFAVFIMEINYIFFLFFALSDIIQTSRKKIKRNGT